MSQETVLTMLHNGKIVTAGKIFSMAEPVAIEDGQCLAVGGDIVSKAG